MQATILRKFRAALSVCRSSLDKLEPIRGQFDTQELRQVQLIEAVVNRYSPRRTASAPTMSREPDPLPRSLLGVVDVLGVNLIHGRSHVGGSFRRR